ncbi:Phosphoribosylformimino-5-aminoimidazole carboxamide ribotide isomerase [Polyporus arcularius HHB13444]|uniref:1-(5-phosphoribosyl)-5-[(5-phosphoribosylamino)methylideneamino] imidazole-4-carboxamide isomerase n=1 Tax=Polyporus arcularius HHB13444 TaxID=1314778 RepID=A0A5C3PY05_9APHY|nr:Phosphoribosylformimino-5-aminoimidazole carboxamide ribotide isomerase [Polyporus arcularius HHB13444]
MAHPRRRSLFRPCIDLHNGEVKQIVGGTLNEDDQSQLKTNFPSAPLCVADAFGRCSHPSTYFAELYRKHGLEGGHVIKLGPGNDRAAKDALAAWPGHLQVGGGITAENAQEWIDAGASKVIVTSYLFPSGKFSLERLQAVSSAVGKDKLVVDVSCRRRDDRWLVAMNKWQTITDMEVCKDSLDMLSEYCSEFLIHAADVEGLCQGIDEELVSKLGQWVAIPTTYAGGAKSISDLASVDRLSEGKVDLTYGSSLDIFGGTLVKFEDLVKYNNQASRD